MNFIDDDFGHKNRERTIFEQNRWLNDNANGLTLSVAWHVPNKMKANYSGFDSYWLSKELGKYFNKIDRKIFKAAHKNRGIRLRRIITLEKDDAVGWHAHGLIDTAPQQDDQYTRQILRDLWIDHTSRFNTGKFDKYLFYGEIDRGKTLGYITKNVHNNTDSSKGFIDLNNTFIPYKNI